MEEGSPFISPCFGFYHNGKCWLSLHGDLLHFCRLTDAYYYTPSLHFFRVFFFSWTLNTLNLFKNKQKALLHCHISVAHCFISVSKQFHCLHLYLSLIPQLKVIWLLPRLFHCNVLKLHSDFATEDSNHIFILSLFNFLVQLGIHFFLNHFACPPWFWKILIALLSLYSLFLMLTSLYLILSSKARHSSIFLLYSLSLWDILMTSQCLPSSQGIMLLH